MDLFAGAIDLAFILLAILLIHRHHVPDAPQATASTPGAVPSPRPPSSPLSSNPNSPSPSSGADRHGLLNVPSITVTHPQNQRNQAQLAVPMPLRPALPGAGGAKGRHKKKSVSFSLSSMDDFLPPSPGGDDGGLLKRRPPTPFMRLPRSPSEFAPIHSPAASPVGPTPSILNNRYINAFNAKVGKPIRPMINTHIDLDNTGAPSPEETHAEMRHSPNAEDPMGVRKQWLMA
ncbi:hypothetical protein I317_02325 [Kwoniella heveanensis CBS 569]|nr:hypothetical protein I317_02325 [Kwoniella heveanensis CBS 569]